MMETEKDLLATIERACALNDGIDDEICSSSGIIGFGGIHGRDGHLNGFAADPFAEIQSLTAVRAALQMVGIMLLSLRLQSQQQRELDTALMPQEESRSFLIKKITDHHGQNLEVIKFMKSQTEKFIRGAKNGSKLMINVTVQEGSRQIKKQIMTFIKSCIWILLHPLKLQKAATLVGRFAAVMAGVLSVYLLYQSRQQHTILGRETPHPIRSSDKMQDNLLLHISPKSETLALANAKSSFNALHGRG